MRFTTFATIVFLARLAWAYGLPGACSGNCDAHDPAIIQRDSDKLFYRFWTADGISIASAPDISGPWTFLGKALPAGTTISSFAGVTNLWAPDVSFHNGMYYMYYAVSAGFGSQTSAIGVATSLSLDPGTWTDHGSVGVSSTTGSPYNAIDPNLIQVGSSYYLNFGSFWGDIYQVKMNPSLLTIDTGAPTAHLASTFWGFPPVPTAMEASYMYYRVVGGRRRGKNTACESVGLEILTRISKTSLAKVA
ncbi:hypothetical protein TWF696_005430 [Orbilia brochopaga]|uniref:Endo-1,5-alpha-L-arabinanase A n=1 Tax=Orbilia brochopaga TaxID=3140254 RepID=A0AAV9V0W7_9PEZI